jgi:hypothetical protein
MVILGCICEHFNICISQYKTLNDTISNNATVKLSKIEFVSLLTKTTLNMINDKSLIFNNQNSTNFPELKPTTVIAISYLISIYCLKCEDNQLRSISIQTLCSTFYGCPKLILHAQKNGVLTDIFEGKYSNSVIEKLLISLHHMMDTDEVLLLSYNETNHI